MVKNCDYIKCFCHDLSGGCLAFVVLEHMVFCFDSSPCAPLSLWCLPRPPCYPICYSSSPPALYSVLIISPLSCPRICCLVSVRLRCSEAQIISLLVVLADPVLFCLFFLVLSVCRSCFRNPSFYIHACLSRTLVGSLP